MKKVGKIILPIIIFLFCFISISDYQLCIVNNSFMFLIITYYVFFYFKKYTKNVQNIIFSIFATLCFLLGREYQHCNEFIQNLNMQNIIFLFLPHSLPIFNFFCRYFFNLLTFQNPFKINGFPIFFTRYFVDMLTLLLYYNRYSTFLLVYVEFRRIMA